MTALDATIVDRDPILDAIAALYAAERLLLIFAGGHETKAVVYLGRAGADLKLAALGPDPEEADVYDIDPTIVEIEARGEERLAELLDQHHLASAAEHYRSRASKMREEGTIRV